MISGQKNVAISENISGNGTTTSDNFSLPSGSDGLILQCVASNRNDGSFTAELEHSPDGVNFKSAGITAALAADGLEFIRLDDSLFHIMRIKLVASAVTTGADLLCALSYHNRKQG
jgi:hypothetical protein